MSKTVALVSVAPLFTHLSEFASAVVTKSTRNSVKLVKQTELVNGLGLCLGAEAFPGAHTSITLPQGAGPATYRDLKVAMYRAVLPFFSGPLALRDAVDVMANAGIDCTEENEQAKKSFAQTARLVVDAAKARGSRLTLLVKPQQKFHNINTLFAEALQGAVEGQNVAIDTKNSADVANMLVMFPEKLGVIAMSDTPAAENVEGMFGGLLGGVCRSFVGPFGRVAAGTSPASVAFAVASILNEAGMAKEAKAIETAVLGIKSSASAVKDILATL